ncbi:MAG: tryptophan synthase subunit alpha [Deltaproteobacteria bacterium]|nr:tryptophan synthase subunit alpha [Deltaproteobacteria bacterium]
MSRIDQTFKRLKDRFRVALIPFIVAGDPDLSATEALLLKMAEAGADMIELGVPFSEPVADGPTIWNSHQRALQNGVGLKEILSMTGRLMDSIPPLILMTYFKPVSEYGRRDFAKDCKENGIEGVIIPDLSPEDAEVWIGEARKMNLDTIFLIDPNSPPERIRWVIRSSRGFIYYASVAGMTGTREKLPEELESSARRIKEQTKKPVAIGFGISTPEQVKGVSRFSDGVIVGSAIVKIIEENVDSPSLVERVGDFVSSLAEALKASA